MSDRRINTDLVLLHWLMALLFLVAVTGIVGRAWLPSGNALRPTLRSMHMLTGQLIFVFAIVRAIVRWRSPMPPAADVSRLTAWAGRAVHGLLYGVMFAQPLSGVLFMQAGDKEISSFGFVLPQVIASGRTTHFAIKAFHQFIGNAFYGLVALHVAAALWHHHVLKDGTLRRMLKFRREDRAAARPEGLGEVASVAALNAAQRSSVAAPEWARGFGTRQQPAPSAAAPVAPESGALADPRQHERVD